MSLTLCVLLWPRKGHHAELIVYEDYVLSLLPDHGAQCFSEHDASARRARRLKSTCCAFRPRTPSTAT